MPSSVDIPGTPNSMNVSGSPSTPGSVYSNPYNFSAYAGSSSPSSTRSHYSHVGSPSTTIRPACYGRPIRGAATNYRYNIPPQIINNKNILNNLNLYFIHLKNSQ